MTQNKSPMMQQNLMMMYMGLVFRNWADGKGTKLGTAKQKALQQLDSYAKAFQQNKENNNAKVKELTQQIAMLKKSVSKQIMESKDSEFVMDEKKKPKFLLRGEQMVQQGMNAIRAELNPKFQDQFKLKQRQAVKPNDTKDNKQNQNILVQLLIKQQMRSAA